MTGPPGNCPTKIYNNVDKFKQIISLHKYVSDFFFVLDSFFVKEMKSHDLTPNK